MLEILKHNLGRLIDFSGRTAPKAFWLYFAVVLLTYMGALMITMVPPLASHGAGPPNLQLFMGVNAACAVLAVLLLAASGTRRLHDSNRRGWWGLMPLPFLAGGLIGMSLLSFGLGDDSDAGTQLMALMLNNLIYLALLGLLVVFLCLPGTRGPNRFGDRPTLA